MKAHSWWVLVAAVFFGNASLQAQIVPPPAGPTPAPPQNGGPAYSGEAPQMIDGPGYAPGGYMPQGGTMPQGGYMPQGDCYPEMGYGGYCGDNGCGDCSHNLCDVLSDWCHRPFLFSCCGRGYAVAEAVMLQRSDSFQVPLVTFGAGGPVVMSANDPYFHLETLPRVTVGYVMPNDTAIEATYWYKDDFNASYGVADPGSNLFIIDPAAIIPQPYTFVHLDLSTAIHSAEVNLVETGRTFNFLAGFRWIEIQDNLKLNATNIAGAPVFSADIDTYNSMFGAQGGMRASHDWGLIHAEVQGKAGMYFNDGDATVSANATGFNAPVSRSTEGECESFVGELSCMLSYRPSASVAVRAGYQVYWIVNTALAEDQIFQANPIGGSGVFLNDRGDLTLHGPSAGIDVRF